MTIYETRTNDVALLKVAGPIATLTLNRPEAGNAIDLNLATCLADLIKTVENDVRIRVVIIDGNGRSFSVGGDLQSMATAIDDVVATVDAMLVQFHAFIATLRRMPKLVVTSVHGAVVGGGLSLAFIGDFCVAAANTMFTPAYARLGLSPDGGGTISVTQTAGARRAMQVFLAEESFPASRALAWGLVNTVVPESELRTTTEQLAMRLAQNAPQAIAETKALIYGQGRSVEAQLDAEKAAILRCIATDSFKDALKGFVRQRPRESAS